MSVITTFTGKSIAIRHRAVSRARFSCKRIFRLAYWTQIAGNPTSNSWHGHFPHSAYYPPFRINFPHFQFRKLPSAFRKPQFRILPTAVGVWVWSQRASGAHVQSTCLSAVITLGWLAAPPSLALWCIIYSPQQSIYLAAYTAHCPTQSHHATFGNQFYTSATSLLH